MRTSIERKERILKLKHFEQKFRDMPMPQLVDLLKDKTMYNFGEMTRSDAEYKKEMGEKAGLFLEIVEII